MRSDASKIIIGVLLVFGVIYLYVLEFPFFQNTLNISRLLLSSLLTGAILGSILGFQFGKKSSELLERTQIFIAGLLLTTLIMPLLISVYNRKFTSQPPQIERLEFLRQETFAGSRFGNLAELKEKPDGFRIYLLRNGEVLRLQKKEAPFQGKKQGEKVDIPVYRGPLGIEYIVWE